jgi:hypothetical protein
MSSCDREADEDVAYWAGRQRDEIEAYWRSEPDEEADTGQVPVRMTGAPNGRSSTQAQQVFPSTSRWSPRKEQAVCKYSLHAACAWTFTKR